VPVSEAYRRWIREVPDAELERRLDAFELQEPAAAAHRRAWPARCDEVLLARWLEARRRENPAELAERERLVLELARREEAARARAQLEAIEAAQRAHAGPGGLTVEQRASRYLETVDGGPGGAWRACLAMARGFSLGEGALPLLQSEYAPRYHRALPLPELRGMVQRATRRGKVPWGYLLEKSA